MQTTTTSKKFTLAIPDFLKGLVMFVGTPVLYLLQEMIPGWEANPVLKVAISATITYLLKNFFAPSQIVIKNPSPNQVEAVKEGHAVAKVVSAPPKP